MQLGIMGNDKAKRVLLGALEAGRPSHAYLFEGPKGVGKFTTALDFARALMGLTRESRDAGAEFVHPDFTAICPDGPTNTVKIDQVRAIARGVAMRPTSAQRKVFVVDDADRMTEEAANSILKTLEEPPPFMVIILVTSSPSRILPTIRSRCSAVPFAPVDEESLKAYLIAHHGVAEERAAFLSRFSAGSVGLALATLRDEESAVRRTRLLERLAGAASFGTLDTLLFCQEHGEKKEYGPELARTMRSWFRDVLLVIALGERARPIVTNIDLYESILASASAWSREGLERLLRNLGEFETALNRTRGNVSLRLALESFMLKSIPR